MSWKNQIMKKVQHARFKTVSLLSVFVIVRGSGTPGQSREICIWEASVVPGAVVFEGELTGTAGRVPISGVNNYIKRRHEQRAKSKTYYKILASMSFPGKTKIMSGQ